MSPVRAPQAEKPGKFPPVFASQGFADTYRSTSADPALRNRAVSPSAGSATTRRRFNTSPRRGVELDALALAQKGHRDRRSLLEFREGEDPPFQDDSIQRNIGQKFPVEFLARRHLDLVYFVPHLTHRAGLGTERVSICGHDQGRRVETALDPQFRGIAHLAGLGIRGGAPDDIRVMRDSRTLFRVEGGSKAASFA